MHDIVRSGKALYWGTSEWPAERILEAFDAVAVTVLDAGLERAGTAGPEGPLPASGLAQGIDAAAHRGALAAGAPTIAFLGHGIDRVYPAVNRDLAHAIVERGALVSEYALGAPPERWHFPERNRLISGLSLGTLVVEAARRSGSLITARLAGEQGREIFALPGSIHNPLSRGCHALIRQGATCGQRAYPPQAGNE